MKAQLISENTISIKQVEASSDIEVPDKSSRFAYSAALDGIRGLSILVVMAFNAHLSFVRGGYIGVGLFFTLSGFLITSLLVQEYQQTAKISLKNFYFRRALRLLPALFALMLFVSVYAAILQPREKAITTWKGVIYALFYIANWVQVGYHDSGIGALSHAWSLSVEEQFYILFPIFLLLLLRREIKRKWLAAIFLTLISASIAWSVWLWQAGAHYLRLYLGSDTRASELLIGCLAALLMHWGAVPKTNGFRNLLGWSSLLSVAAIFYAIIKLPVYSGFLYTGGFALIALGTAILIVKVLHFPSPLTRIFEFPPLVWIGKVSYGLYLWHFPIFGAAKQLFEGRINPLLYEALRFGSVFVVAAISFYLLEKPFLKLKQRFNPAT